LLKRSIAERAVGNLGCMRQVMRAGRSKQFLGAQMMRRCVFRCLIGGLWLSGAAAQAQDKAPSKSQAMATLVVLNVCSPMAQLTGLLTGPSATVRVDGRELGTVDPCSFRNFSVASGDREVIVRASGFALDLGLPGPRHKFVAGRSTYISAVYRQYFETRQIDAGVAKQSMDAMRTARKK
jgi:hypothetical protein